MSEQENDKSTERVTRKLDDLVRQEFNKLKAKQEPWVDVQAWADFLNRYGVERTKGARHNRTDGEWHEILKIGDQTFDHNANYWEVRRGWESAVKWVLSNVGRDLRETKGAK